MTTPMKKLTARQRKAIIKVSNEIYMEIARRRCIFGDERIDPKNIPMVKP